jgi:hypothetical protein
MKDTENLIEINVREDVCSSDLQRDPLGDKVCQGEGDMARRINR